MDLNGKWKLYYAPQGENKLSSVFDLEKSGIPFVEATVPGNVELDLSAAGILPEDLFKGMNILRAEKYENYEWWYEKTFSAPAAPDDEHKVILHFGAVDCIADYYLNGEKIGESDNMFISQDFDVTDKVKYGEENTLHVHIASAVLKGASEDIEPNMALQSWHATTVSLNVRKAPHSYGWDIMPRAVSAGIWRPVELQYKKKYDFRYLYFKIRNMDGKDGIISLAYDSDIQPEYAFKDHHLRIYGKCGDSEFYKETDEIGMRKTGAGIFVFTIPNIKLWWPKHYGEPNLYDITVELIDQKGDILISKTVRRGFRTLELRHSEIVEPNGCFEFVINGKRIMATGTNWVPMDAYHSRDNSRYEKALSMTDDLGCNIIRCWGGNVYEDHDFFNYCDEHGILVWQDFAMACHQYPQHSRFMAKLEKEAEWVVKELRDHPSLALWSGDNEIDSMLAGNGVDPATNRLTREVLPRVVERLDPERPYIASSPYISSIAYNMGDNRQGSQVYPEDHLWGPRDYFKSSFYTNAKAYFVSETGYHGCPNKESIEKFIDEEYVWPYENNRQWNLHSSDQRHNGCWSGRTMLMHRQVAQLFGEVPTDMEDYILASQISQAEAKKFFVEHMRAKMSRNGGVIWWNLVDGWPQMSDAIVDYYYSKKLAYGYIKRSQRGFMIMLDEMNNWKQSVITANSTLEPVKGHVKITDMDSGKVYFEKDFTAGANCNTKLGDIPLMYSDKGMFLIEWELENGEKHFNTYLYGAPGFDLQKYKGWLEKINSLED